MIYTYNSHLNPRPYPRAPHVKFHIQKPFEAHGVAMCGGIFPHDRFAVFSSEFVQRMDQVNQCLCCMKEQFYFELRLFAESVSSQSLE